jgi:hypothetical protein
MQLKIDAVPAIHWTIVQLDSCRLRFMYSNAKAVIFFFTWKSNFSASFFN